MASPDQPTDSNAAEGKKKPSHLSPTVLVFPIAIGGFTCWSLHRVWEAVNHRDFVQSVQQVLASSPSARDRALGTKLSLGTKLVDASTVLEERALATVRRIRIATVAIPSLAVAAGSLGGAVAAQQLTQCWSFFERRVMLRRLVSVVLGGAGLLTGVVAGMAMTGTAVVQIGSRAIVGVVREYFPSRLLRLFL